jgi:hypothetical protein
VKILLRTPDRLVLADSGASLRAIGGIFIAVGAAFLFAGIRDPAHNIMAMLIGPILGVIGLAFVLLPSRVTASFDRPSHTLVITRHTLRTTTRDEVDLSKVSDVVAEQSVSAATQRATQATFRVTIVLRDGYRLPLTSWYTSGSSHAQAAAAARAFLGIVETPPATPTPDPMDAVLRDLPAGIAATVRTMQSRGVSGRRFPIAVFILFAGCFTALGSWLNYQQYRKLSNYVAAPAIVLFTDVASHRGNKGGMTYSPVVTYRYHVGERDFVSSNTTVMRESRSGMWAQHIASRYHRGDSTTAWYDPTDPTQAFLVHEYSGLPSIFIAVSVLFMLIGFFASRAAAKRQAQPIFTGS